MYNKNLQESIIKAVDEQISNRNPKEVVKTFNRLKKEGYSEFDSKKMIGACLLTGIYNRMSEEEAFDNESYIAKLKKLPDYFYELTEETDDNESDGSYMKEDDTIFSEKVTQEPVRSEKISRNEPCPCGSGKKYKKCCGS